ncbi:Dam family site-specific DNA-(adenine-N6)-methyltransferase [Glaciecola sp. 2405UD65-10]|uniref:Dam family site-specific DNA-(adenine-N6)-methyltransferase n=1 Tax=Glaciecola sp. 2405UD65-10 TaxID=3397244 RepID=UPI003B5B9B20
MPKVSIKSNKKLSNASAVTPTPYKSPLKWAGGKRRLVSNIAQWLPKKSTGRFIEPFVGGGSVFINLPYSNYLLVDSNPDLIGLFNALKSNKNEFLELAEPLFTPEFNQAEQYYSLRKEFNDCDKGLRRYALFMYLNRHGYNGLCRYNLKGQYNVPFGKYKRPYFPELEINRCHQQLQNAHLQSGDFSLAFEQAQPGDIIYCDPPYFPLGETASFTAYSGVAFSFDDQQRLALLAEDAQMKGVTTVISNHHLPATLSLYQNANKIVPLKVSRTISCKGSVRKPIKELLAIYKA